MCDLVVSKVGYSTVSEAVRGNVPLLLLRRKGFAEDKWIIEAVEEGGFGREITGSELKRGKWVENISNLTAGTAGTAGQNDKMGFRYHDYKYDGIDKILDKIKLMIL